MTSLIIRFAAVAVALLVASPASAPPTPPQGPGSWPSGFTVKFEGDTVAHTMTIDWDADGSGLGDYDRVGPNGIEDTGDVLITVVDNCFVIHFESLWVPCSGVLIEKKIPGLVSSDGHAGYYTFTVDCTDLPDTSGIATESPFPRFVDD